MVNSGISTPNMPETRCPSRFHHTGWTALADFFGEPSVVDVYAQLDAATTIRVGPDTATIL